MDLNSAMELGRNALWMTLLISAPVLVVGLVVGLFIAFLQAVTQLQEQSLTFVPKIAAMVVATAVFIPWVSERILEYTRELLGGGPW